MAIENKVYFKMGAVQFGGLVAYIKETTNYQHRFENDVLNAFVAYGNRRFEESARWVVRIARFGYEIEDKATGRKTSFHNAEAVAAYFEGVFDTLN